MNSRQKEEFLLRFEQFGRVLYSLLPYLEAFRRGIDLVGERLSGVLIAESASRFLSAAGDHEPYFGEKFGDGFGFAYRFPRWEKSCRPPAESFETKRIPDSCSMDGGTTSRTTELLFPEHWHPQIVSEPEEFEILP
jgi:DNA excision repair protein ERCC-2